MFLNIIKCCNFSKNYYFIFGILLGLILSVYIPEEIREIAQDCPNSLDHNSNDNRYGSEFEPELNLAQKPLLAKKMVKNIIRPRYYSSELGIKEKLFVGVMTSQENIDTLATSFNKTSGHIVNKIKYFINADNVKTNFKLKNIVGFTDTRENLKPFHVLKYIADNYLDDYDYFLITLDTTYLDARKLRQILSHISISLDVYIGTQIAGDDERRSGANENFCDLNAGIVFSSSVIRKIRTNLDWCVRNAATNFHSFNIGKCVKYSSKIDECQSSMQGVDVNSFSLNTFKVYRDLYQLKETKEFNSAITVYPVGSSDDFYLLHAYFSRIHLELIKEQTLKIEDESQNISNGTVSPEVLEVRWPIGVPESESPDSRHDILAWTFMNLTHSLLWDSDNNVKELPKIESDDIQNILMRTLSMAKEKYRDLTFIDLQSAYRKFDPVRGMDYKIYLNFKNQTDNQMIVKGFEIVKPLGLVEIVPSPYVTESTRITLFLTVFEHQIDESINFVNRYEKICMENPDNTFLMLIFMYRVNSSNKGIDDVFFRLKNLALNLTEKYKIDGSRVHWVSIRLPIEFSESYKPEDSVLNTIYGRNEILSLAVTDLALRKIGLESLVMLCSNSMIFRSDFLNRVRMNTIQSFQIFSPIGFMQYPCSWSSICKECETCDVGQGYGYFDRANYDVIAFYSRDYVEVRKKLEPILPIVRNDHDIVNLLGRSAIEVNTVIDMFVKRENSIHILRGIEPNLRFGMTINKYLLKNTEIPQCAFHDTPEAGKCIKFGSRKQIGAAVLDFEENVVKNPI